MLLTIHIAAGGLAMILGAVALLVKKGGTIHRRAGLIFVGAMVIMGSSASILAYEKGGIAHPNFLGGFTAGYLVVTAFTTVRPASVWTRGVDAVAAALALVIAIFTYARGIRALGQPHMMMNGVPAFMMFFLGTVFALAFAGDMRVIFRGALRGAARLRRHLWRMCFALFVAAGSFFSIRSRVAKILPWPFLSLPMRMLPILLIFVAMFYWLWRVRGRQGLKPTSFARSSSASGLVP